jgi:UDP-N-acetyl-D-glucosamine dehydrogenase
MKVAIIGLGYVGKPLVKACLRSDREVVGIDINPQVIKDLAQEFGVESRFKASSDYSDIVDSQVIVICVPTPLNLMGHPDLSLLENAIELVAQYCQSGALVIVESTSFIGSLRKLVAPKLLQSGKSLKCGVAPERIDPGNSSWSLENTTRVVSGIDQMSTDLVYSFYAEICQDVRVVQTPEIAEASKLFENTFRLVNIALTIEIGQLLAQENVNIFEVIDSASTKPFGFMPFYPSLAIGGHCIPIDPAYLNSSFAHAGLSSTLIEDSLRINDNRMNYVTNRLEKLKLISRDSKIQILGLGYKRNSSDIRESGSLKLLNHLRSCGYKTCWYDPKVLAIESQNSSMLDYGADIWIIGNWMDEFQTIDFSSFKGALVAFSRIEVARDYTIIN